MRIIKLTNEVTKQPLWINGKYIMQIDEIAAGSRIVLVGNVVRIVKEDPGDILKKLGYDENGDFVPPENFKLTPAY